jgi:ATP-dependent Clp protease adaptor protein ClpS
LPAESHPQPGRSGSASGESWQGLSHFPLCAEAGFVGTATLYRASIGDKMDFPPLNITANRVAAIAPVWPSGDRHEFGGVESGRSQEDQRMTSSDESGVATLTATRHITRTDQRPRQQPRYHVILWDDDDHSYEYVVLMMKQLFGHPYPHGFKIAKEVDSAGRAICLTTTKEHAELKRDQIKAFGKDCLIDRCKGSMSASIEPEVKS